MEPLPPKSMFRELQDRSSHLKEGLSPGEGMSTVLKFVESEVGIGKMHEGKRKLQRLGRTEN